MSEVHHFAYTIDTIDSLEQEGQFWLALGFNHIPVEGPAFEQKVRQLWFKNSHHFEVHVVVNEDEVTEWGWAHLCVIAPDEDAWHAAVESPFLKRHREGSERVWFESPAGARVEVRKPSDSRWQPVEFKQYTGSVADVRDVLTEALAIYEQRHPHYGDQWKKYGWRGAIYNARRKVERMWAQLWDSEPEATAVIAKNEGGVGGIDDGLDTIVYLAMAIVAVREGNRDGMGAWWD